MILELDCGNSFIKWRVIPAGGSQVLAGGVVNSDQALIDSLNEHSWLKLAACRLVSVRTDKETDLLVVSLMDSFAINVVRARPAKEMLGVRNGYDEYEKLGLDRWLALLGSFHLAGGACLVLDLGTAVTADFVAADGQHLGGFICPGMPLMRNQLRTHTRRIRYADIPVGSALPNHSPGRNTLDAVERGCALMLRGFVLTQLELAQEYWGKNFVVFLTGGDACMVNDVLPQARLVPDLVFVGLAIACPFS